MSCARQQITEVWLDVYVDELDLFSRPRCQRCGEQLMLGGYVDGMWPYHSEYSVCGGCESRFGYAAAEAVQREKEFRKHQEVKRLFGT